MHPSVFVITLVWLTAPGSFALIWIEFLLGVGGSFNLALSCMLVPAHVVGGAVTLALLFAPGPQRGMSEYWALYVYGTAFVGWCAIGGESWGVYWVFVWIANATTCAVTVSGLVRMVMRQGAGGDEERLVR